MPRTKEAIATVRGFCKHESKGTGGDALFAKGILAAIRWMTEKDSPCPYAELAEDLDDEGGWEDPKLVLVAPESPNRVAVHAQLPQGAVLDDPYANIPRRNIDFGEVPQLLGPDGQPILGTSNVDHLGNNNKMVLPGSFEKAAQEHEWIREIAKDLKQTQRGTPLSDNNAVIVGGGLEDSPVLAGSEYDYDE